MYLSPERLLSAYCQGVFPMAEGNGDIYWYDPDPRAIIPLDQFHIPRSLSRTVRQNKYEIRIDSNFSQVIRHCSRPGLEREEIWIDSEIMMAYELLHELGFAHSVETWKDGQLVGGLYGVAINGLFAGESMFSHQRDASKVALVALVSRLKMRQFQLLDIQFQTEHLRRFGAVEISQIEYRQRLAQALQIITSFKE